MGKSEEVEEDERQMKVKEDEEIIEKKGGLKIEDENVIQKETSNFQEKMQNHLKKAGIQTSGFSFIL